MVTKTPKDGIFLRACRREPVDRTPVWLMRQAGRYMAEYRELRRHHSLLDLCKTPDLAAEVTLQPIRRFGFDAAILFADILLPIEPMGLQLEFAKGEGPIIHNPLSTAADVEALRLFDVREDLGFVLEAVRLAVRRLGGTPLIGFAGAPFTLASYMIEGGYSRHFIKTKQFMQHQPQAWHALMGKIAEVTRSYLLCQADAGATAVQLFDSWVGALGPQDYREFVLPYSQHVLKSMPVPSIHFSTGTASYLELIAEAGGDVIGVDWRIRLDAAWERLLAPQEKMAGRVREILRQAGGRPGHVFNLGHGVFPETPVENVERLVREVHDFGG
jgi:uroporphyrinogen decarboxylase